MFHPAAIPLRSTPPHPPPPHLCTVANIAKTDKGGKHPPCGTSGEKQASNAKQKLKDNLMMSLDFIQEKKFFLSDDFSIIDCSMAPILWRLPEYGIQLPASAKPIMKYADRIFERTSFIENLSEQEEEIRSEF